MQLDPETEKLVIDILKTQMRHYKAVGVLRTDPDSHHPAYQPQIARLIQAQVRLRAAGVTRDRHEYLELLSLGAEEGDTTWREGLGRHEVAAIEELAWAKQALSDDDFEWYEVASNLVNNGMDFVLIAGVLRRPPVVDEKAPAPARRERADRKVGYRDAL